MLYFTLDYQKAIHVMMTDDNFDKELGKYRLTREEWDTVQHLAEVLKVCIHLLLILMIINQLFYLGFQRRDLVLFTVEAQHQCHHPRNGLH